MDNDTKHENELSTIKLKLESILRDSNTKLPTLSWALERLREEIELFGVVGIIISIPQSSEDIESTIEWEAYDRLLFDFADLLTEFKENHLHHNDFLFIRDSYTSEFIFAISSTSLPKDTYLTTDFIISISQALKNFLENHKQLSSNSQLQNLDVEVGYSRILHNPATRIERQVHCGIEEARRTATRYYPHYTTAKRRLLSEVIANENINTLFQPIVFLNDTSRILGYEALSSGPKDSEFSNADMMFTWANRLHLDFHLDIVCRKKSLINSIGLLKDEDKLFLNTNPRTIKNPQSSTEKFMYTLNELDLPAENIVLEITERTPIGNFDTFGDSLTRFRDQGFSIALDDVGAGYASLNSIARLRPDYLKFDIALTRNIDRDLIKQELLITIMDLAERIGATVIAEGIERVEELNTLKKYNVPLGQGFLISPPIPNPRAK